MMKWKQCLNALYLTGALMAVCHMAPVLGAEKPRGENAEITTKDLSGLVDLLEDPQKRETFIRDLKHLIQIRETESKGLEQERPGSEERIEGEGLLIENWSRRFDQLSSGIINTALGTGALLLRAPEAAGEVRDFLSSGENRARLLRLFAVVLGSIFVGLLVHLFLRKRGPHVNERDKTFPYKMGLGLVGGIMRLIPYGVVLLALFLLFPVLPSFPLGHSLALLFFMILFFYRAAIEIVRLFISPEEGGHRLLPLSDEMANYYWLWVIRLANYAAFYFLVVKTLTIVQFDPSSFSFIRGLLLVVFPLMLTVLIMQVAREWHTRHRNNQKDQTSERNGAERLVLFILRYWPIPAIVYSWAIFIFLMVRYHQGFSYLFKGTLSTVLTMLVIFLALRLLDALFKRFFGISQIVKDRFPGLEEKTNRYIRIIRRGGVVIVMVMGLGVIAQVWGLPVSDFVGSSSGSLFIMRALAILITVAAAVAVMETSQLLCDYTLRPKEGKKEPSQKMRTLMPMINTATKIAAGFIAGIVILDRLGVNTTPILAGAGIVGLAVGFGSQTLVKDVINGLFILFEDSIRVRDYVMLGNKGGIVEAVGLRIVRLRDVDGNVHVVPNSSIDMVTNLTKEFSRSVVDVGVAYRENVDEVIEVLKKVGEEMRNDPGYAEDILEPMEILGLDRFEDSAVIVRTRFTTKPLKQWAVKREFNRRIKQVFDQLGIEIPFPHRTIYMGEPKTGAAPPLNLMVEDTKTFRKETDA